MGLTDAFSGVLDGVLGPLVTLGSFWTIFVIASFVALLSTLAQKYTTDQKKLKEVKIKQKKLQKEMKASMSDPKKRDKLQKEIMGLNSVMMKQSFKPLLYTIIPLLLIFGWMNVNLAYTALEPNTPFEVTAVFEEGVEGMVTLTSAPTLTIQNAEQSISEEVEWTVSGEAGIYELLVQYDDQEFPKRVIIDERKYEVPLSEVDDEDLIEIRTSNEAIHPFGSFSFFGWNPGWFGTYFLLSIILSLVLRRLFKVV